jgi:hypothetical protein
MLSDKPTLPLELILPTVALSLPVPSFQTYQERTKSLRSYALVSRDFYAISQPLLYSHIVVSTSNHAGRLVKSLHVGKGQERAVRVASVRFGSEMRS